MLPTISQNLTVGGQNVSFSKEFLASIFAHNCQHLRLLLRRGKYSITRNQNKFTLFRFFFIFFFDALKFSELR